MPFPLIDPYKLMRMEVSHNMRQHIIDVVDDLNSHDQDYDLYLVEFVSGFQTEIAAAGADCPLASDDYVLLEVRGEEVLPSVYHAGNFVPLMPVQLPTNRVEVAA